MDQCETVAICEPSAHVTALWPQTKQSKSIAMELADRCISHARLQQATGSAGSAVAFVRSSLSILHKRSELFIYTNCSFFLAHFFTH
jgi:hypothetical protein